MPHSSTIITAPKAFANLVWSFAFITLFPQVLHARPPAIPLANVYHEGVELDEYWVSEKLDGVRAYWDGEDLWSRGGHVYRAPEWFTEDFPSHPLDGELWSGRGEFAALSGVVRKSQPVSSEWQKVTYNVFDLPERGRPFDDRYARLEALVAAANSPYLSLVIQRPVRDHESLMTQLQSVVAAGGEGLMLKRKASLYQSGRSDDLLKVKPYQDAEAVVVGHTSTGLPRFASYLRVRADEPK